jgi:DNA-binding NarL/FixJ family response regulator
MAEVSPASTERLGVVATDPLRVLGLKAIFSDLPQFEVEQLSVPGVLNDARLSLVLIDAKCTDHVLELLATFRHVRPQLKLVVLGEEADPEYVQRVIAVGAKGYLPLTANEAEIRMAVEMVRDGSIWAPRKVLARLLDAQAGSGRSPSVRPSFTPREVQILNLLHSGHSNREIALALGIDPATVKAHIGRLMRKVGVNNRVLLTMHPFTQLD